MSRQFIKFLPGDPSHSFKKYGGSGTVPVQYIQHASSAAISYTFFLKNVNRNIVHAFRNVVSNFVHRI